MTTKKLIFWTIYLLSFLPIFLFTNLLHTLGTDGVYSIARLIALISLMLLFWQYILGFRGLSGRIFKDIFWLNKIHRMTGEFGFLFIMWHPILITIYYASVHINLFAFSIATPFYRYLILAKIGFTILSITWILSAIMRKRLSFRFWKTLHFINYLILPLLLIHSLGVGTDLNTNPNLRLYWEILFAIYMLILTYRILFMFGFTRLRYEIVKKEQITNAVQRITMKPLGKKFIAPTGGQFIYSQLSKPGEEHPFTASHYDKQTHEISVSPKLVGPYTKRLHESPIGTKLLLDGAYGVFTKEAYDTTNPVVLLVGGIGITPFLRLIDFSNSTRHMFPKLYLFYANRAMEDVAYKDFIDQELREPNRLVHYLSQDEKTTGANIEHGYITIESIKKYLDADIKEYEYFLCGPAPMMKLLKKDLKEHGVPKNQVHFEVFSL